MTNAVQWMFAGVAVLGIALPVLAIGFGKPWRRHGTGWRGLYWGMAIGLGFLVSSYVLYLLLASAGRLRYGRLAAMNEALVAAANAMGVGTVAAIAIIGALALMVGTSVVAARAALPRRLPASIDFATLRSLARRGMDVDELRAAYSSHADLRPGELETALTLGAVDVEAGDLASRVGASRSTFSQLKTAAALQRAVRAAATVEETVAPMAELRQLTRTVEAGY